MTTILKKSALQELFQHKSERILNVYCTAGYPELDSLKKVIPSLQEYGADIIEVGIPYSDPVADGPVIQQSNQRALKNGMTLQLLLQQLHELKERIKVPIVLMGYLNPVLQYGMQRFCADAAAAGVSGIILPDLPQYEYEQQYKPVFKKFGLDMIFLVGPETSTARVLKADHSSSGFLYALSSSATTGTEQGISTHHDYLKKLRELKLKNPVLIGFGIRDRQGFEEACSTANGGVIGSAYIKAIGEGTPVEEATQSFMHSILG